MRKYRWVITLLFFTTQLLTGCIEEYEADISAEDSHLLVVEGTICANSQNTFILSRTQSLHSSETPEMVRGARVTVRGTDGSEVVAQDADGRYSCSVGTLSTNVEYYLHIETDGEVYESEPQHPLATEKIATVRGVQNTPESAIDVLVTLTAPANADEVKYYSWTYDETWEVHSDYTTFWFFDTATLTAVYRANQFPHVGWKTATCPSIIVGASTNYASQHIQNLKLYDIGRDNERMLHRYSGLVSQRAITKAEYEYELARRQAGSEMGGLFTPQPSALPTNLHCLTSKKHAIGFVGCSLNVSHYRFFLDGATYSIYHPLVSDSREWLEDCSEEDCRRMATSGKYLCDWQDDRVIPGGVLRTAWAYDFQLDVRSKGASVVEPDFWSLKGAVSD